MSFYLARKQEAMNETCYQLQSHRGWLLKQHVHRLRTHKLEPFRKGRAILKMIISS